MLFFVIFIKFTIKLIIFINIYIYTLLVLKYLNNYILKSLLIFLNEIIFFVIIYRGIFRSHMAIAPLFWNVTIRADMRDFFFLFNRIGRWFLKITHNAFNKFRLIKFLNFFINYRLFYTKPIFRKIYNLYLNKFIFFKFSNKKNIFNTIYINKKKRYVLWYINNIK